MSAVAIIGLGYVGLPLFYLCMERGYRVYGVDIDKNKIDQLVAGICPIKDSELEKKVGKFKGKINASTDYSHIKNSDVIIVTVPTPVDANCLPDLRPLINASEEIQKSLKKEQLIIIESTIYPGVTQEVIQPILEKSGLKAGSDFYLAHCPERVDPGNIKWNVSNIARVVGGVGDESTQKAAEFYRSILDSEITEMSSVKAAEAVKVIENSFRDVNIAFVNELAMSFDKLGIDVLEVINSAASKPFAFMPHFPGCGVGGHCIPVDPYYLIEKAKQNGFDHKFLKIAREINENMPEYTIKLLEQAIGNGGSGIKDSNIGILGVAYKGGVDDMRESPALKVIDKLRELGARLEIFDPYVLSESTVNDIGGLFNRSDYVVVLTDHPEFRRLSPQNFEANDIRSVIDGRNCLDKNAFLSSGVSYKGIGR